MNTVSFTNNGNHRNMIYSPVGDDWILFDFEGHDIPGVAVIRSEIGLARGTIVTTDWVVELAKGVYGFRWTDFNKTGGILGGSWEETIKHVNGCAVHNLGKVTIPRHVIERYVKCMWKEIAARFDRQERTDILLQPSELATLLQAQKIKATH